MAHTITCAECGAQFDAMRDYAELCSVACRNRRYRARRTAAQAREIEHAAMLLAALRGATGALAAD